MHSLPLLRLRGIAFPFLLFLLLVAPLRAAGAETRERLGSFRFALHELPALLAPAPPIYAYLKDGRNENPYADSLPRGSVVGVVERRADASPRDMPAQAATYELVLLTGGSPITRSYVLEADKFQVRLLFAELPWPARV